MNRPSNNPPKKPQEPAQKPEDALERQLTERRRVEHDKHLSQYRQPNPRTTWGS